MEEDISLKSKINYIYSTLYFEKCNVLFHTYINNWFTTFKKPFLKSKEIEIAIRLHICTNIENKILSEITNIDIQNALNKVKNSRTKETVSIVYNELFNFAMTNNDIKINPMSTIKKYSHCRQKGRALKLIDEQYFLKRIEKHPQKNVFLFLLYSGLRRSELLSLRWKDIDYDNNTIIIKGTKTKKSERVIPLFDNLRKVLETIKKDSSKIFKFKKDSVTQAFSRIMKEYKLHDLRHTFATRCLESGIDIKIVQKWLGHASYKITADIYTDVLTEYEKTSIDKINIKKLS